MRPLPILDQDSDGGFFTAHTYHLDIRFEAAFTQMHELADAILHAVQKGKRVIVEHFDMIYPFLRVNAHLLIGMGEEVIITRPTVFGPQPQEIYNIVSKSVRFRRMAHTAEDLAEFYMPPEDCRRCHHSDVKHGFVLVFDGKMPEFDIDALEKRVQEAIAADLPISYVDEEHISIGEHLHECTGPRTHVPSTGCVENFRLIKKYFYDPINDRYLLAGRVGETASGEEANDFNDMSL